MKFNSFLNSKFEEYIVYRQTYGFTGRNERDNLVVFDQYLQRKRCKLLSELDGIFFLEMVAAESERCLPQTVGKRISVLHKFFQYLERIQFIENNPLTFMARPKGLYYQPHIFNPQEIKIILDYLSQRIWHNRSKNFFLARFSHYTALSLQAACGLRISEVINLKIEHFNPKDETLYIHRSKFRKDRLIPISNKTIMNLQNYLDIRRSQLGTVNENPYFFLTYWKDKGNRKTLAQYFVMAVKELGMYQPPQIKGNVIMGPPCTHSLRHSFAVNTIRRWKAEGKNINQIADTLATYMGHCSFSNTQTYLKALNHAPEILIFDYKQGDQ